MSPIDEYLTRFEGPQLASLETLRDMLRRLLPDAEETISYRMPCFKVGGKAVAGFDGFARHCSYFPHSGNVVPAVIERWGPLPSGFEGEGGTLRFPIGRPPSATLVKRLVTVRLDEIEAMKRRR